jgi:hypothetical protein
MSASHPSTTVGNASQKAFRLALVILWVASFAAPPAGAQGTGSSKFHVESQRLQGPLEKLSEFGRNPEGGLTRIGFSETDLAAREYVIGLMKQAGLEIRVDPAGNIFGRRAGSENLPILLTRKFGYEPSLGSSHVLPFLPLEGSRHGTRWVRWQGS